jgi:hypothetical protein
MYYIFYISYIFSPGAICLNNDELHHHHRGNLFHPESRTHFEQMVHKKYKNAERRLHCITKVYIYLSASNCLLASGVLYIFMLINGLVNEQKVLFYFSLFQTAQFIRGSF